MPAPPPMQMTPLQFAKPTSTLASQLTGLGKNLASAGTGIQGAMSGPPAAPLDPGSAVPGAQGPTAVGGPGGPAPLVQPGAQPPNPGMGVGQAGNLAAGPVAPPNLGGAPGLPGGPGGPPPPGAQPSPIPNILRSMSPPQILQWLQSLSRSGQNVMPNGMPGSAATQGAGMLPATMNNPSQFGG